MTPPYTRCPHDLLPRWCPVCLTEEVERLRAAMEQCLDCAGCYRHIGAVLREGLNFLVTSDTKREKM